MSKPLTIEDARALRVIIVDAVMRMDALAKHGGHDVAQIRATAVGGFAMEALQAGQCRGKLLSRLEDLLQGRCVCEIETKGSA